MSGICACKVIINELLCFVQCQTELMDEVSLHQILSSNFSESEIESAKYILFNSLNLQCLTRKGTGKVQRHLQDIIKTIKETEPNSLPIFVARELRKLPPVSFDHVDVTKLLKDITLLKQEIFLIKSNYSTVSATHTLQEEVACLRKTVEERLCVEGNSENSFPTLVEAFCGRDPEQVVKALPTSTPEKSLVNKAPKKKSRKKRKPAASAGRELEKEVSQVEVTTVTGQLTRDIQSVDRRVSNILKKDQESGFVRAPYHKNNPSKVGSAPASQSSRLKAAPQVSHVYVSQLSPDVTEADLNEYIAERVSAAERPTRVTLLGPTDKKNFASYKITVPQDSVKLYLCESFWPINIKFRIFENRKFNVHPPRK